MDDDQERQQLIERDRAWAKLAESEGDVEEILEFWTDDAVVIPPGMPPVVGKEALRAYVEGTRTIPGFSISWTTDSVEVSADGSMAWILGTNLVEMDTEAGHVRAEGRVATVWRKEHDGTWRCCLDMWNDAPADG
ncbi:YybH family protein [Nocardioides coralli]|uniref:YybH family protein n=1 Tax=Nocardioides coralli TaxID=2872154 RepID=UPI001CA3A263|nr:DUF4440 domain-containing protein [Nocardioides coralli]QZY30310.1 DUF4440 domain-containing protein [Nocardioides coralli]